MSDDANSLREKMESGELPRHPRFIIVVENEDDLDDVTYTLYYTDGTNVVYMQHALGKMTWETTEGADTGSNIRFELHHRMTVDFIIDRTTPNEEGEGDGEVHQGGYQSP